MRATAPEPVSAGFNDYVRAYEEAVEKDGRAEVADFLPAPDSPLRIDVLCELVRIDLELVQRSGNSPSLDPYQKQFPELFTDAARVTELAFEEYRLRCVAGEQPSREDYEKRFAIDTRRWPAPAGADRPVAALIEALRQSDPPSAMRLSRAMRSFPEVGKRFVGFDLERELGRGAFGRVYLARQDNLARRRVALKVSPELGDEPQALAQLQHTHIVPIHSFHREGPLQAVCMPYFGSTTLADVLRELRGKTALPASGKELLTTLPENCTDGLTVPDADAVPNTTVVESTEAENSLPRSRLRKMSYVDAVLWLGARLADGLAHAHERGILHRDLKPANILLTDEGQPMLLDFNLAQDTKFRDQPTAAQVGGTLPYMAPEHLEAFGGSDRRPDPRSDLYALGVILWELLTLHLPFEVRRGKASEIVPLMLADRQVVPRLRKLNSAVSPAVEAILRKCLEPDPARRYESARQMQEDLERHLASLPLRHIPEPSWRERFAKWNRRHPRAAVAAGIVFLAGLFIVPLSTALVSREKQLEHYHQEDKLALFRRDLRDVHLQLLSQHGSDAIPAADAMEKARRLVARYEVLDRADWLDAEELRGLSAERRRELGEQTGDLLLLWARVQAAHAKDKNDLEKALNLNERAENCFGDAVPRVLYMQQADLFRRLGRSEQRTTPPEKQDDTARDRALAAFELAFRGRHRDALAELREATRLDPRSLGAWLDRALCHERLGQDAEAEAAFSTCLALAPDFTPLYFRRGLTLLRQKKFRAALSDFETVLNRDADQIEAKVNRSLALVGLDRVNDALKDLDDVLAREKTPSRLFFTRARLHVQRGDLTAARADIESGKRRKPCDEQDWVVRGMAYLPSNTSAALEDLRKALSLNPRSLPALRNQAYILAELRGKPEEAVTVLDRLLELYPDHTPARAGRAVLYARLGKRPEAHRDALTCLSESPQAEAIYQLACVYALTSRTHADDAREALHLLDQAIRQGYGRDHVDSDPDLKPLNDHPDFARLKERHAKLSRRINEN